MKRKILIFFILLASIPFRMLAQCNAVFPYLEDFENGDGGWVTGGFASDWTWGMPSKVRIARAGSGSKCWITGGLANGSYNGGEKSWLQSPCFDFTTIQNPYISFLIYWDTERQYDGGNLQYSLNGGSSWSVVGSINDPVNCRNQNWFNNSSVNNLAGISNPQSGWSGTILNSSGSCLGGSGSGAWLAAKHCMANLAGQSSVIFRFTFASGTACNAFDGIAIDSIYIGESSMPSLDFSYNCLGGTSVEFIPVTDGCASSWNWDFGDPSSLSNTGNGISIKHDFSTVGNYTVTLTMNHPCSSPVVLQKNVIFPEPIIAVTPVTCKDGNDGAATATLNAITNPVITWDLNPPIVADSVANLSAGNYSLTVSGNDVCTITQLFEIIYGPDAFPKPDLGSDLRICPGESLVLNPGKFSSYVWTDLSIDSIFTATKTGIYFVEVLNEKGCSGKDTVEVREGCGENAWIPEAFTPNDDALNEFFLVSGIDLQNFRMEVYNRWGQMIFFSEDAGIGWDGTFEGEYSPAGLYAYRVRYSLYTGDSFVRRGSIRLIR